MSNTRNWPNIAAHGLTIGGKHTFTDWSLLPTEIPVFAQAIPKLDYQSVPGADGALDYTQAIVSKIKYEDRTGSFSFIVLPDTTWEAARTTIANFLKGQRLNCILDDDPTYFYTGRFWVDEAQSNRGYGTIVISYRVDPYKQSVSRTGSIDWLWNDLFDVTIYYGTFSVNGTKARNLINPSSGSVTPKFTCSAAMTVEFDDMTYDLPQGTTTSPGFQLQPGDNEMTFTGTGTVLVDYSLGKSL